MSKEGTIQRSTTYDSSNDTLVQHSTQDIQPMLELNKKEYNKDYIHGGVETPELGMRKVASIPLIIVERWRREHGIDMLNKDHMPKIKELLNSSEYRFLRTHESNI